MVNHLHCVEELNCGPESPVAASSLRRVEPAGWQFRLQTWSPSPARASWARSRLPCPDVAAAPWPVGPRRVGVTVPRWIRSCRYDVGSESATAALVRTLYRNVTDSESDLILVVSRWHWHCFRVVVLQQFIHPAPRRPRSPEPYRRLKRNAEILPRWRGSGTCPLFDK